MRRAFLSNHGSFAFKFQTFQFPMKFWYPSRGFPVNFQRQEWGWKPFPYQDFFWKTTSCGKRYLNIYQNRLLILSKKNKVGMSFLYLWIKTTLRVIFGQARTSKAPLLGWGWGEWDRKIKKIVNNGQWFVNFCHVEVVIKGQYICKIIGLFTERGKSSCDQHAPDETEEIKIFSRRGR